MYVGVMVMCLGWPLVLGSWWAYVPVGLVCVVVAVRTAFGDGMLRAELPGYEQYAGRTRWRLIPGVW
jgi:protein-S-isoprenylcysteine O-methyltransferase Ste14